MSERPPAGKRLESTLDERYTLDEGWTFMSGTQALVRLPIQQRIRDAAAGHATAGFISGYRGSPLGRYDFELWRAAALLERHHIRFQPGVNEDLAATAAWGSQYVGLFPGARHDGVFAIWYGKGPGVDRSGDALRHANAAGTGPLGGVVALAGDDHAAKSSTTAHQSEPAFIAAGIPVLYPGNVQEILDLGLHAIAMSRHSGCWVALKLVTDVVESSGPVLVAPDHPRSVAPRDPVAVPDGLGIRGRDMALPQEERLLNHKLHAALAYARANALDRIVLDSPAPRLGIVSAGKSYADVRQALSLLGIDEAGAAAAGIRLLRIGMVWPLDPEIVTRFADGLETVLVVEEKRPLLENQLKTILFDAPLARRPRVVGKFEGASEWSPARGSPVLPMNGELSPPLVAAQVARLLGLRQDAAAPAPLAPGAPPAPLRLPNFCSGCPHNLSTKVLSGSRALAGIGCHAIARIQDPERTVTISHMGAEGAMWVGQAPFTDEPHVFANLGDGTYFHSGFLAIRQAVAANVPITYKLLVNGFVSMTGGQPIEGDLSIPRMAAELLAEGVGRVVVVTDDPGKYRRGELPPGVPVRHRRELEAVQRELREHRGVSVLVYDQICAAERRRQRKRGKLPDPPRRVFIHPTVCEGCGDCSAKSNCMSVEPLETELGRKRRINQSSCNKDYSCVEGFCPSFVSVIGGELVRGAGGAGEGAALPVPPEPELPPTGAAPVGVLVTGIGGTGVVTVGAILGMAAHLDGKAATVLDVTGLAQKYGAVLSHVRIAPEAGLLHAARLAAGEADVVLGCDLVVSAGDEALARMHPRRTRVVLNTELVPTSEFARDPDWRLDEGRLRERVRAAASTAECLPVTRMASGLMGDAIAVNVFMLGFAWQKGWIPLSRAALERAIELNAVAVPFNRECFLWGRRAAHDRAAVERLLDAARGEPAPAPLERLDEIVAHRTAYLTSYQDARYAARYRALVDRVARREREVGGGERLAVAVARSYAKLLANKDEFEVARLYASPEFRAELGRVFEGGYRLRFHLGAGPFAGRDAATGEPRKREVGPWVMGAFEALARLRGLRGTWLDPFRGSPERRAARELLAEYERDLETVVAELDGSRIDLAVELASWPERVRGYAHVRAATAAQVAAERAELRRRWGASRAPPPVSAGTPRGVSFR
jgi:indolepyruvate ferredoxin oxidoreductase